MLNNRGPVVVIDTSRYREYSMGDDARSAGELIDALFAFIASKPPKKLIYKTYPFVRKVVFGYRWRPRISPRDRQQVISRGACVRCGSTRRLSVDHIVPLSRGGAHNLDNFQCLCMPCNRAKGTRMESEL